MSAPAGDRTPARRQALASTRRSRTFFTFEPPREPIGKEGGGAAPPSAHEMAANGEVLQEKWERRRKILERGAQTTSRPRNSLPRRARMLPTRRRDDHAGR